LGLPSSLTIFSEAYGKNESSSVYIGQRLARAIREQEHFRAINAEENYEVGPKLCERLGADSKNSLPNFAIGELHVEACASRN